MIAALLRIFAKAALALRYRIRVRGIDAVAQRGRRGILFLPNHPALIDPVIVTTMLHYDFAPHPLADKDQMDRPGIGWFARQVGVRPVLDMARYGASARDEVEAVVRSCAEGLRAGENILLYPSGHLYRSHLENIRGNSAVESILELAPDTRIVLVRTRGLWGSSFSFADGTVPDFLRNIRRHISTLLKNFVFFTPRRPVTLELFEPDDLPRDAGRNEINEYMERFYNEDAPPNRYVPYTIWEGGETRDLPDPQLESLGGSTAEVSAETRRQVYDELKRLSGNDELRDDMTLAQDLGLDSLARAELLVWLGREFGFHGADVAALRTVADVLLATRGETAVVRPVELKPVPRGWRRPRCDERVTIPEGETITEVFLAQAARHAGRVAIADQNSGARTYRDLVTGVFALRPHIAALEGERVGIMLPASVGACVTYLATLFAGKTPVLINWTTGTRNILHALDTLGVRHVLTAGALVARIESQGTDLGSVKERLTPLEEIGRRIGRGAKLGAWFKAHTSWAALRKVKPPETAAILLTSGSEALPKAVPLTHTNLLTNIRDALCSFPIHESDSMIGFMPPFHSFGLCVTMLMPLLGGLRVVYHANPTEAWVLAKLIAAYRATIVLGTPTFMNGIVRAAGEGELATLRLIVTGAEACPQRTHDALRANCPEALVLEGYGVTECSPIVSVNRPDHAVPQSIGQVLPSLKYAIVDVERDERVKPGAKGMLLVRGPSVFGGYLGDAATSPFVEFEGESWYRTGDLVSEAEDGVLTFRGRLKRFLKLGGEMISMPAIENVLSERFASPDDEGPILAVEASADDHPEVVLFTTRDIDRQAVNDAIREAHLSALHNVRRVVRVDELPLLGTGKTDYRALKRMLESVDARKS